MKYNYTVCLIFLFLMLCSNNVCSQGMTPVKVDSLIVESVKSDVWVPFMESYRKLDFKKFESLYTSDLTRVSIDLNKIETPEAYFKSIHSFFEIIKTKSMEMDISFSIITTATSEKKVYQTGYYTIGFRGNDKDPFQSSGYSFFSVIIEKDKESNTWKISMDSDKKVKITQEEFLNSGTIYKL